MQATPRFPNVDASSYISSTSARAVVPTTSPEIGRLEAGAPCSRTGQRDGRIGGMDRDERSRRARQIAEELVASDVRTVALTFVDNAGVTRVKTVPVRRFEHAAAWGVGMSPVFDVFLL